MIALGLLCVALLAAHPAWADDEGLRLMVAPGAGSMLTLSGKRDVPYELDAELLLGMSLGVAPASIAPAQVDARWHPLFGLVGRGDSATGLTLDGRPKVRWFWSLGGSNHGWRVADPFDIRSDFTQHFSLQSKAGFVLPFGERWLLGAALTLDRRLEGYSGDAADPVAYGAFLGVRRSY